MKDREIVELLRAESEEFRQLEQEHRALENRLSELDSKHYLSPEEEVEIKSIKKQKLAKKDRMAEMIREYKKAAMAS